MKTSILAILLVSAFQGNALAEEKKAKDWERTSGLLAITGAGVIAPSAIEENAHARYRDRLAGEYHGQRLAREAEFQRLDGLRNTFIAEQPEVKRLTAALAAAQIEEDNLVKPFIQQHSAAQAELDQAESKIKGFYEYYRQMRPGMPDPEKMSRADQYKFPGLGEMLLVRDEKQRAFLTVEAKRNALPRKSPELQVALKAAVEDAEAKWAKGAETQAKELRRLSAQGEIGLLDEEIGKAERGAANFRANRNLKLGIVGVLGAAGAALVGHSVHKGAVIESNKFAKKVEFKAGSSAERSSAEDLRPSLDAASGE